MRRRLLLWALASAGWAFALAREAGRDFRGTLSFAYIVDQYHVAPWGVLGLCFLWLYLKRREIEAAMAAQVLSRVPPALCLAGLGAAGAAWFIPATPSFLIPKILVGVLGLFTAFFGRGVLLPAVFLATYAWTILFPLLVRAVAEVPYALAAVIPAAKIATFAGLPVAATGQVLRFPTPSGEEMAVLVSGACAGPATMAVFMAIFTLMLLDVPLPGRKAAGLFLFGLAGTWLQNVLRILVIVASGHYGGPGALWTAHFWTIYLLFPLWYLVFAAVYFRVAGRGNRGC